MAQKRKKRILVYEIRITVWTDFMQKFFSDVMAAIVTGLVRQQKERGHITQFEFSERVLDGKTYQEIKK